MVTNPALLKQHNEYIARAKACGAPTRTYTTPCCNGTLEDRVPGEAEEQWDSLVACPFCGALFMKVAHHDSIMGRTLSP